MKTPHRKVEQLYFKQMHQILFLDKHQVHHEAKEEYLPSPGNGACLSLLHQITQHGFTKTLTTVSMNAESAVMRYSATRKCGTAVTVGLSFTFHA
jgi:hypothetical protein